MFHLQVRSAVGMSPLLLEKNNTKGSLTGMALAKKQSNKTLLSQNSKLLQNICALWIQ